jgi:hypothetical protein
METIEPYNNEVVMTENPKITISQMYHINFDEKMFLDNEKSRYIYLITTPRLRYLQKFRVGSYMGTFSELVDEFKARGVDVNILRFERIYADANKYVKHIMDIYDNNAALEDGWINTTEISIKNTFDKVMAPVKFDNIEHTLGMLRIIYESRNEMSETALGMVVLALRRLFDTEYCVNDKYSPIYNKQELSSKISSYNPNIKDDFDVE